MKFTLFKNVKATCSQAVNKQGFTIVELLIAIGLFAIVTLAITKGFSLIGKSQSTIKSQEDLLNIMHNIGRIISNSEQCSYNLNTDAATANNFSSLTLNANNLTSQNIEVNRLINKVTGAKVIEKNMQVGAGVSYKVDQMMIQNFKEITPNRAYIADLLVKFSGSGQPPVQRKISILLGTTGANPSALTINSCNISDSLDNEDSAKLTCLYLGGTWDSSKNPPCELSSGGVFDYVELTDPSWKCVGPHNGTCAIPTINLKAKISQLASGTHKIVSVQINAKFFNSLAPPCSGGPDTTLLSSATTTAYGGCPSCSKPNYYYVQYNPLLSTLNISGGAGGWGSCGGNPCNACVSDVKMGVVLEKN